MTSWDQVPSEMTPDQKMTARIASLPELAGNDWKNGWSRLTLVLEDSMGFLARVTFSNLLTVQTFGNEPKSYVGPKD